MKKKWRHFEKKFKKSTLFLVLSYHTFFFFFWSKGGKLLWPIHIYGYIQKLVMIGRVDPEITLSGAHFFVKLILAINGNLGVFGVADHDSGIRIAKLKMADPRW